MPDETALRGVDRSLHHSDRTERSSHQITDPRPDRIRHDRTEES
jgi:hypothetical protein